MPCPSEWFLPLALGAPLTLACPYGSGTGRLGPSVEVATATCTPIDLDLDLRPDRHPSYFVPTT